MMNFRYLALALLALAAGRAQAAEFPADAGALNVRDFGAKGDGVSDDTTAINAALAASGENKGPAFWQDRIVYLPDGTYLISSPIAKRYADGHFASGSILMGQSREHTILKLKDDAEGYDDPSNPRALIFTTAKLLDGSATGGGKDYEHKGEGNDAFMNFVENMTVDTGHHAGAIGIDYLASNIGAVRNVSVEGEGAIGIALNRKWPGPALIQNVTVQGFDTGIVTDNTEYGMTLDRVKLIGQRKVAISNDHNVLSIHDLTISGKAQAIANHSPDGLIVIDGAKIDGDIDNHGFLNLHNVSDGKASLDGVYEQDKRSMASRWSLAGRSAPKYHPDPASNWVSVTAYGAHPDSQEDDTAAIRKAFASGASTIYFPHGIYYINDNIFIPSSVHRIMGMTSTIRAYAQRSPIFRRDRGMFRARNDAEPLLIEKLAFDHSFLGDQVAVEAVGSQPVILRDIVGAGVMTLLRPATGGEAYIEDTCCGSISVAGRNGVWARQLNTEGPGVRIENRGSPLWILGLKSEQDCTALGNHNGARTEILGGLLYITGNHADPSIPAFTNTDATFSASYAEEAFSPDATYATHLIDMQHGQTRNITRDALPKRNDARMVPKLESR